MFNLVAIDCCGDITVTLTPFRSKEEVEEDLQNAGSNDEKVVGFAKFITDQISNNYSLATDSTVEAVGGLAFIDAIRDTMEVMLNVAFQLGSSMPQETGLKEMVYFQGQLTDDIKSLLGILKEQVGEVDENPQVYIESDYQTVRVRLAGWEISRKLPNPVRSNFPGIVSMHFALMAGGPHVSRAWSYCKQ